MQLFISISDFFVNGKFDVHLLADYNKTKLFILNE